MSNHKTLERLIKTAVGYKIFKQAVKAAYFIIGLAVLRDVIWSKKQCQASLPQKIENFEDLYWLFSSNFINRGIIKMDFNEAAYMFGLIKEQKPANLLEIGACEGGSTMLISTAKSKEAKFVSVDLEDNYNKTVKTLLDENTSIILGDSKKYVPPAQIDFIFIDGDHSFEGVKSDFDHYFPYLKNGADIIFHDAVSAGKNIFVAPPVNAFVKQLEKNRDLKFIKDIGSIRHLKKTE